jgi:hypothetical protein
MNACTGAADGCSLLGFSEPAGPAGGPGARNPEGMCAGPPDGAAGDGERSAAQGVCLCVCVCLCECVFCAFFGFVCVCSCECVHVCFVFFLCVCSTKMPVARAHARAHTCTHAHTSGGARVQAFDMINSGGTGAIERESAPPPPSSPTPHPEPPPPPPLLTHLRPLSVTQSGQPGLCCSLARNSWHSEAAARVALLRAGGGAGVRGTGNRPRVQVSIVAWPWRRRRVWDG